MFFCKAFQAVGAVIGCFIVFYLSGLAGKVIVISDANVGNITLQDAIDFKIYAIDREFAEYGAIGLGVFLGACLIIHLMCRALGAFVCCCVRNVCCPCLQTDDEPEMKYKEKKRNGRQYQRLKQNDALNHIEMDIME